MSKQNLVFMTAPTDNGTLLLSIWNGDKLDRSRPWSDQPDAMIASFVATPLQLLVLGHQLTDAAVTQILKIVPVVDVKTYHVSDSDDLPGATPGIANPDEAQQFETLLGDLEVDL